VAGTCGYGERLSGSINAGNFLTSLLVSFSRRTLIHGVSKYIIYFRLKTSYYEESLFLMKPVMLSQASL
jgi:hypothetical protein